MKFKKIFNDQRVVLTLLTIALFIFFGLRNYAFFNVDFVIYPLLRDGATLTVIGLAQLCVLSIGHLNLAVGRMAAVSALVAGASYQYWGLTLVQGAILGVLAGALLGAITGWIIVKSQVNAFIVTLAMDFALLGLVTFIYVTFTGATAAFTTKPAGMDYWRSKSLADFCLGPICGPKALPMMLIPAIFCLILVSFMFSKTRIGRELLSTGSNLRAAKLSGIPVENRVMTAHIFSGTLAGIGGLMLAYTNGSFTAAIGSQVMLPSFLGPVLGGTLLAGGAVAVLGTFIGTMMTLVIRQGLSVQGIGLETLNIALGLVLLLALSVGQIQKMFTSTKLREKK
ncbi:MAG: ABC transporter permease [Candidatus Nanopelagicaceae bacterium]|nr:ABC transporter permease [Candidatus Nanopelagicaceae bacterium]